MSVQRYTTREIAQWVKVAPDAEYVPATDHARIVAEAVAEVTDALMASKREALAAAVDEGRKFVLAIWDDGYNVEQRMAAAFRKGQEAAAPRTLTADENYMRGLADARAAVEGNHAYWKDRFEDSDGNESMVGRRYGNYVDAHKADLDAISALIHDGEAR